MKLDIEYTNDASNQSIKALLVGFPGSGKTYQASKLPPKTLVISCEAGTLSLQDYKIPMINLNYNKVKKNDGTVVLEHLDAAGRLNKLGQIFNELKTKKEFDNIFLDSLTEVAETVLTVVQNEFPDRKDSFPMWGEYAKRMRRIVKSFRDLDGYNVFMTCLAEVDKDENNRRFIGCDVPGKIGKQLPQFFDEVLYLYMSPEGEHRFHTKKIDTNVSKDRSGKLDADMPADLGTVMIKIFEKQKKEEKK
jgi:hypothetical protein